MPGKIWKAKKLAVALENEGWSVWWDRSSILPGQNIDRSIKKAIAEAQCLLVIWSRVANDSLWVIGEANIGLRRHILVQIHLGEFDPPINFQAIHSEDFSNWNGARDGSEYGKLKAAVIQFVGDDPLVTQSLSAPISSANMSVNPPPPTSEPSRLPFEPEMVIIPAGSFQMGGNRYDSEQPIHPVTFTKPFKLGKYPVTFAEYDVFAEKTGRKKPPDNGWGRERCPVINVSWRDAVDYAAWLNKTTCKAYRLPSEVEWEYACRTGSIREYFWGDDDSQAAEYAWFNVNSDRQTHPVEQKKPNSQGT